VIGIIRKGRSRDRSGQSPRRSAAGTRRIAFGRELYIERDDFMENPPKKFFRLSPGTEVRLRTPISSSAGSDSRTRHEVVELALHLRSRDPRAATRPDGRRSGQCMWLTCAPSGALPPLVAGS